VKLVHSRADAPRRLPEEMRRVVEKLREIFAEIAATESPFPPDRPPPASPLSQRIARGLDELPEETEAAERQAIPKLASRGRH
jgi:hypothetical protein